MKTCANITNTIWHDIFSSKETKNDIYQFLEQFPLVILKFYYNV